MRNLVELRSTNCRFERPTAVMIPNMTVKMPPMMGLGIVTWVNRGQDCRQFGVTLVVSWLKLW